MNISISTPPAKLESDPCKDIPTASAAEPNTVISDVVCIPSSSITISISTAYNANFIIDIVKFITPASRLPLSNIFFKSLRLMDITFLPTNQIITANTSFHRPVRPQCVIWSIIVFISAIYFSFHTILRRIDVIQILIPAASYAYLHLS